VIPSGAVSFLPVAWSGAMAEITERPVDVALVQVSPPDVNGWLSLGISVSYTLPAVRRARTVIAQVNKNMPFTMGNSLIHMSEIDAAVEIDSPLPSFPFRPVGEVALKIAETVARLVPDGATLQPGIGALPSEVLRILAARGAKVRLHSMLTDAGIELAEQNGCRGRPAIVGEVVGSTSLYEFVDRNHSVLLAPANETHSLSALLSVSPFVSVNSALEVDLFGQVNLEFMDGIQAGGVGGSLDFAIAAAQPGNLSILALRSTTGGGSVSRIVARLGPDPVSIPRTLTQVIVTEHGVADLRGCSVAERAERLIAVADPDHRAELRRSWDAASG
jgi:4-hydroxybutyrate CoA-transferase